MKEAPNQAGDSHRARPDKHEGFVTLLRARNGKLPNRVSLARGYVDPSGKHGYLSTVG